jgi:hypothetical protein
MNTSSTDGSWSPSVKYLLILLIAEILIFGFLRGLLNQGG